MRHAQTASVVSGTPVRAGDARGTAATRTVDEQGSPQPAIRLDDVGLVLDGSVILAGVTLEVAAGEVVSIVGPSGCGKTTLLNIVAGLLTGCTGSVTTDTHAVTGPGPDRCVVFQEDAVFPWMTVRKNVAYAPTLRGAPRAEIAALVGEMVALVGLSGKEDVFPRQLSGGQRKRVDLARALAARPQVLLMDEPYAALDQMTKQRLQSEFLNAVAREGMTSMFVTHDLEEAIFVADRIVVMAADPGRIVDVVDVPFGLPRTSDLRMSSDFQRIRRHVDHLIHDLATAGEPA